MPAEPVTVHATSNGACPYCGAADSSEVDHPHPGRSVLLCASCSRYSTARAGGRRYPHDDPSDANSSFATAVKIRV